MILCFEQRQSSKTFLKKCLRLNRLAGIILLLSKSRSLFGVKIKIVMNKTYEAFLTKN
ncbi:hypothetical protein HMPREF0539_0055, partial [Lacticaseibacillus rhamnosus LMS2-1]